MRMEEVGEDRCDGREDGRDGKVGGRRGLGRGLRCRGRKERADRWTDNGWIRTQGDSGLL